MTLASLVVSLEAKCLDKDILKHVKDALIKKIGTCTQESGYILSINNFVIDDTEISRATGAIVVRVKANCDFLKPEISKVYPAIVTSCVNSHGVYLHYKDKLKILVMERTLDTVKFENGCYTLASGVDIKVGSTVDVKVTATKYEKNNYQSIGIIC